MMQDVGPLKGMFEGFERGQKGYLADLVNKEKLLQNTQTEAEMPWEILQKAASAQSTDLANQRTRGTMDSEIEATNATNKFTAAQKGYDLQKLPDQFFVDTMTQTKQKSILQIESMISALQSGKSVQEVATEMSSLIQKSPMQEEQKQNSLKQLNALYAQYKDNPAAALQALIQSREQMANYQVDTSPEAIQKMREIAEQGRWNMRTAGMRGEKDSGPSEPKTAAHIIYTTRKELQQIEEMLNAPVAEGAPSFNQMIEEASKDPRNKSKLPVLFGGSLWPQYQQLMQRKQQLEQILQDFTTQTQTKESSLLPGVTSSTTTQKGEQQTTPYQSGTPVIKIK